jgi:hypothetical protein
MALVLRAPAAIAEPAQVDDELAHELAACVKRWAGLQAVGLAAMVLALNTTVTSGGFTALAAFGLLGLVGNHIADRAAAKEMEDLGLAPNLARAMLRRMYRVPEALSSMLSVKKMKHVIRRTLEALDGK